MKPSRNTSRRPEAKLRRKARRKRPAFEGLSVSSRLALGIPDFPEQVCRCEVAHRGTGLCPSCHRESCSCGIPHRVCPECLRALIGRRKLSNEQRDNQYDDPIRTYDEDEKRCSDARNGNRKTDG